MEVTLQVVQPFQRTQHRRKVAARQITASTFAAEQRIAGKQTVRNANRAGTRRMSRCVVVVRRNAAKGDLCTLFRRNIHVREIIAVFQPHTFSRTEEFQNELAEIMNKVDKAYIMDIHPAREKQEDYPTVTSDLILNKLTNGEHISLDEAYKLENIKNTVVLFMSPNDISSLENNVIELLENKSK